MSDERQPGSDEEAEKTDNSRPEERRITVKGARRMLGMIGRNYDDDQISEILDILYGIAEVAFDDYAAIEDNSE